MIEVIEEDADIEETFPDDPDITLPSNLGAEKNSYSLFLDTEMPKGMDWLFYSQGKYKKLSNTHDETVLFHESLVSVI